MTELGGWATKDAAPVPARTDGLWPRLALLALGLVAVVMVATQVAAAKQFSPQDELQHFDYLVKVARNGELVRGGDRVGQEAMREEACNGLDYDMPIPPCGSERYDPEQFNEAGYNTAAPHGPTYYVVSGYVARAMSALVGSDSLLTTGRLTGAGWLLAGVGVLWLLMAEIGVGWRSRVPIILVGLAAPRVVGAASAVSPDATAIFAGAAVAWATLRGERTGRWGLLALCSAVAVALKVTNGVVVMMAVLYLAIRWIQSVRDAASEDRPAAHAAWLRPIAMGLVGAGVAAIAWIGVSHAIERIDSDLIPMNQRMLIDHLTPAELGKNLGVGLTPLKDAYVPSELVTTVSFPMNDLLDRFALLGLGAAALVPAARRTRTLAAAAIGMLAVIGPVYVVADYVTQGVYFLVPDRYALSVLPTVMAVVAALLDDRPWLRRGVWAAAAVLLGFALRACAIA